MTPLKQLENKIRQLIPELKEELEAFEDSSIDRDMITQIGLNHVLLYSRKLLIQEQVTLKVFERVELFIINYWLLEYSYLKHQSEELIYFLNELK